MSNRMSVKGRILVIGTELDWVEVNILAGVVRAGFDVHALLSPGSKRTSQLQSFGVEVSSLPCRGRIDPAAIIAIRKKLKTERYDVLHCFCNRTLSNALIASLGVTIKRVAYRGTVGHVSRFDPLAWLTYLSPLLDRIVCVSDAVRRFLCTMLPPDRLVTIYKGHDPAWYRRAEKRELASLGIPDDAFVVSCVANMRPVKGVPYLLEAMDLVAPDVNAHLILVGKADSSANRALSAGRRYPERIHAVGFRDDASVLVSQSDCFVLPSVDREGLPKALLEAMSVQVAPIATSVGGMPEVVVDGENGLLVPPRDATAIARAIERYARDVDLRLRMARAAQETIAGRLNIARSVECTVALYTELCA
jgi:glycosyltransferase involved in cell wall biosynthesis